MFDDEYDYLFKIIILGDSGVGKTNILSKYAHNEFNIESKATIGVEFHTKLFNYENKKIKLQFWDTAGQERYRSITHSYYKGVHGILVVYDISNLSSFNHVNSWISEIYSNVRTSIPILLIGNKSDLDYKRVVKKELATEFVAKHNLIFIETSAMIGTNINEGIEEIVKKIYELNKDIDQQKIINTKVKINVPQKQKQKCC